ncbi:MULTISPECIES: hypothetical protein [Streptomyces]|uniref:hypothetical protein n=1 Tax=Streptomyces TaxID=1883 RepID=UPI0036C94068
MVGVVKCHRRAVLLPPLTPVLAVFVDQPQDHAFGVAVKPRQLSVEAGAGLGSCRCSVGAVVLLARCFRVRVVVRLLRKDAVEERAQGVAGSQGRDIVECAVDDAGLRGATEARTAPVVSAAMARTREDDFFIP